MRNDLLDVLWEPLALRGAVLPNRVMCSATTLQYGVDGLLGDRHVAFYRERARGGVGLLVSEQLTATSISRTPFPRAIAAYDERQVERFHVLAEALREYKTRFFAGGGGGASTVGLDQWGAVRAPSAIPIPGGEVLLPLETGEIEQVILDFARSDRNVRAGGLHGVEVHGSHGCLVGQFLNPFFNRRDDAYGGSVEKRCRLSLEIGRAIRDEVGQEFPVGLALTYDECIGVAGITIQTPISFARLARADRRRLPAAWGTIRASTGPSMAPKSSASSTLPSGARSSGARGRLSIQHHRSGSLSSEPARRAFDSRRPPRSEAIEFRYTSVRRRRGSRRDARTTRRDAHR